MKGKTSNKVFNRGLLRQAWCHGPGLMRAGPSGELHGARLSSVPTGDRSANPASVPGRSGLQRALLSVSSTRKHSGAERLAAPLGVSRAARAAVPCRSSASGHRSSSSKYTRSQFKIVAWDITSPFPPSGNGGYVRNLDVPYLSVTTSYVVTT